MIERMSNTPRVNEILGEAMVMLAAAENQEEFTAALKATVGALIGVAKKMEIALGQIESILARNLTAQNKVEAIETVIAKASDSGRNT
jgi:hypothetical protein